MLTGVGKMREMRKAESSRRRGWRAPWLGGRRQGFGNAALFILIVKWQLGEGRGDL